eukprot:jgi/Picsp_1/1478/NSC_04956-R1_protein
MSSLTISRCKELANRLQLMKQVLNTCEIGSKVMASSLATRGEFAKSLHTKMYSSLARSAAQGQGSLQSWSRGLGYQQVLSPESSRNVWQASNVMEKLQACDGKGILMADIVAAEEEEFSAITDKIPQRPVSVVEGTSYTLVILAALGFAAAVLYAALSELVFSPKEYVCFSKAVSKIKDDPRVTIRLGSDIKAYGTESQNRAARQRIPHRIYNDSEGKEHVQLQFQARGPSGRATVHADMYQSDGEWRYHFLYLTVESPLPQQVVLIRPNQPDQ